MKVEIDNQEAQILVNLIARGIAHLGEELQQSPLQGAMPAASMLAVADVFTKRLAAAQKQKQKPAI